jgi:hypothetical protein
MDRVAEGVDALRWGKQIGVGLLGDEPLSERPSLHLVGTPEELPATPTMAVASSKYGVLFLPSHNGERTRPFAQLRARLPARATPACMRTCHTAACLLPASSVTAAAAAYPPYSHAHPVARPDGEPYARAGSRADDRGHGGI